MIERNEKKPNMPISNLGRLFQVPLTASCFCDRKKSYNYMVWQFYSFSHSLLLQQNEHFC